MNILCKNFNKPKLNYKFYRKNEITFQKKEPTRENNSKIKTSNAGIQEKYSNLTNNYLKKAFYSQANTDFDLNNALRFFEYETIAAPVAIGNSCYQLYKYLTGQTDSTSFNSAFRKSHAYLIENCTISDMKRYHKEISMFNNINALCLSKIKKEISEKEYNDLLELYISERTQS